MNVEGELVNGAIRRLIANTYDYVLVEWQSENSVCVKLSNGQTKWFDEEKVLISEVCVDLDITKLTKHYKAISQNSSEVSFSLRGQNIPFTVLCSSQVIEDTKLSLWVRLPETNKSIQYLQDAVHDMKSPVNSIIGVVNLMQHSLNEGGELEEMKMYLDLIKTTAHKSVNLVNEVMELAEMESANYEVQTEVLELRDFIETYINTHRLITLRKKITIHFNQKSEGFAAINKVKMTRVFDNIISNAVKFSKPNSSIHIDLVHEKEMLLVSIKDEGIGMPQKVQNELFVKFGNAKRKGLDGETSSGLGMSIVKQIMELHGGNVVVESEEGEGTTVLLRLKKQEK